MYTFLSIAKQRPSQGTDRQTGKQKSAMIGLLRGKIGHIDRKKIGVIED